MDSLSEIYTDRPPAGRTELFLLALDGSATGQRLYFPPRGARVNRRVVSVMYPGDWLAGEVDGRLIEFPNSLQRSVYLTLFNAAGDEVLSDFPLFRVELLSTVRRNALLTFKTPVDIGRGYVTIADSSIAPNTRYIPVILTYAD
jgi:hypothetical protein